MQGTVTPIFDFQMIQILFLLHSKPGSFFNFRPPLNLDQDDDSNLDTAAPPPSRGAVADLKDIEAKVQTLQIKVNKYYFGLNWA